MNDIFTSNVDPRKKNYNLVYQYMNLTRIYLNTQICRCNTYKAIKKYSFIELQKY